MTKKLSKEESHELIQKLKKRFEHNMERHKKLKWEDVQKKLESASGKLWSLQEMEDTGGEPDVVRYDSKTDEYIFYDCSPESPKGRRSLCYDPAALAARKQHKPKHSAVGMASDMGVELLTEEEYFELQKFGPFDTKTSSWVATPDDVREKGGGLFGDWRFGRTFIYHNGADSYYGARGFRALLRV